MTTRRSAAGAEGGTQREAERGVREDNWYRVLAGSGDGRRSGLRRGAHAATRQVPHCGARARAVSAVTNVSVDHHCRTRSSPSAAKRAEV